MTRAGFPHSDILGSRFVCQLPEAYRRLQRPSSAPSAKASTLCPYKLDHKDHSKMLASTVQFSSYDRYPNPPPAPSPPQWSGTTDQVRPAGRDPNPPPTGNRSGPTPRDNNLPAVPSGPNSVPSRPNTRWTFVPSPQQAAGVLEATDPRAGHSRCSTLEHHPRRVRPRHGPGQPPPPMTGKRGCQMLLRKEVIQPHLPVRLPCYDLVPIASPTFDSSLHKGWATGFGCYRLS